MNIIVKSVECPNCGAEEVHPHDHDKPIIERRVLIRGYKIEHNGHWWSQCLVCAGYYDADLRETRENFDREKGWF